MAYIGQRNVLNILKKTRAGLILDGGPFGEILLPAQELTQPAPTEQTIDVFVYLDSEDKIIETLKEPLAKVNQFAYLRVIDKNSIGFFLNWGLPKDILLPLKEQKRSMEQGRYYVVYIYLDDRTNRITASARIERYLDKTPPNYQIGEEVDLLIAERSDLGFKAIINHAHWGVIYANEVFKPLGIGQKLKGYIKKIRDDKKIDLCLEKSSKEKFDHLAERILAELEKKGGVLNLSDKSSPEEISALFGVSKGSYKQAIGRLFKRGLIEISAQQIIRRTQ